MIRRPPRSTPLYSSAASDVYKRQVFKISSSSPSLYKKGTFDNTPEQFITESNSPNSSTVFFIQFSADILFNASYSLIIILPFGHLFGSIILPFNASKSLIPTLILFPSFNSLCAIFSPIPVSYTHLTLPTNREV